MLWTISLIMFALAYGGMMEKCRFVESLMGGIRKRVKSTTSLAAIIITGIICDVILTDQYLAIMIPSRVCSETNLTRETFQDPSCQELQKTVRLCGHQ